MWEPRDQFWSIENMQESTTSSSVLLQGVFFKVYTGRLFFRNGNGEESSADFFRIPRSETETTPLGDDPGTPKMLMDP